MYERFLNERPLARAKELPARISLISLGVNYG